MTVLILLAIDSKMIWERGGSIISKYIQNNQELAENMKIIRQCFGLTQKQVAEKLHVERSTYTYYETSKTEPNLMLLIKLWEVYDIEITDLITKEGLFKVRANLDNKIWKISTLCLDKLQFIL